MKTKWSCYYCQENLPTQKMLSDHRREKHLDPEGNFLCKFCEKKNPSYKFMGQHMRDKHPKQSFECVECDRTYPSLHQFKKHKEMVHVDKSVKNFQCDQCSYGTHCKSCTWSSHLFTNPETTNSEFSICDLLFDQNNNYIGEHSYMTSDFWVGR